MKTMETIMSGRQAAEIVAELWRLHGAQMDVYQIAMREELPSELREVCAKGYLIASLCRNEISVIYNQVKSPLHDEALSNTSTRLRSWTRTNPGAHLIALLQEKQKSLLRKYKTLLDYFESNEPSLKVLEEHIFLLKRLADRLVPNREAGKELLIDTHHKFLLSTN